MIKKLKKQNGETLVETLVSMLIAVLSMGILCMATMTATNINMQIRELDEKYSSELRQVESLDDSIDKTVQPLTVSFWSEDNTQMYDTTVVDVTVYGGSESSFLSYDYEPASPEGGSP